MHSDSITIYSSKGSYDVEFLSGVNEVNEAISPDDFVIIDRNIYDQNIIQLSQNNHFVVDASEDAKSFENLNDVISSAQGSMRKNSTLVCIGGGITQDIAGFVSSVLYRGVEWVFVPTTLLAQADSCIGGKTSINLNGIKNQLGSFHPPKKILLCSKFLETLPSEDMVSGVGEAMHYLMVRDDKEAVEETIERIGLKTLDIKSLTHDCLTIKKGFIEEDEFDRGKRLILNYGHTFGHALEAQSDISHGRAVAFGMVVSNTVSELTGLLEPGELDWVNSFLKSFYVGTDCIDVEEYLAALKKDKKNVDDQLTCVLTSGIGKMSLSKVSYETVVLALGNLGLIEEDK